ncbi:uncharacterized protein [Nicotiana tomentosiformis]|uniref:uncharacterized protein n=1 Tax=Nicotiana tomentosiformis TaxID=4098 RepID=UPI00388C9906
MSANISVVAKKADTSYPYPNTITEYLTDVRVEPQDFDTKVQEKKPFSWYSLMDAHNPKKKGQPTTTIGQSDEPSVVAAETVDMPSTSTPPPPASAPPAAPIIAQSSILVPQIHPTVEETLKKLLKNQNTIMATLVQHGLVIEELGLPKDVQIRPPYGSDDFPTKSPAPKQGEEKKRKRAPISPSSEKKKLRRRLIRKPKETSSSRILDSESLYQLRNKSEENEISVARKPSVPEERASVLHHETFLRYREELSLFEAEAKELIEKRYMYKLLNGQHEGEVKSLRAELEVARKEHADLVEHVKTFEVSNKELCSVTNGRNPQVPKKINQIDQLRAEMDVVKVETDKWRGRMDRLASKKEATREQLTSAEVQLRATKEKVEVQAKKVEELKSRLSLAASDRKDYVQGT